MSEPTHTYCANCGGPLVDPRNPTESVHPWCLR